MVLRDKIGWLDPLEAEKYSKEEDGPYCIILRIDFFSVLQTGNESQIL